MDNRLGRLAGLAAFALMLLRLGRLIESGGDAPAWQLIMIASAFLGGVIWWLLSQTMSRRRTAVAIFAVAGLVLFLRIAVPHTLVAGFVPTGETLEVLGAEMSQAINIIRFGVAPIFPTSGVVAILAVLMWGTGGLYVWGASDGPTAAMVLPSLALYLQFAVMDRVLAGRGWMGAAAVVIAMAVAAIAMERRSDAGRVRDLDGRPLPRRATAMAFVLAVIVAIGAFVVTDRSAALVPPNGNIQWRVGSGYGAGIGGIAFDRLADLQQNVISRSNAIVFTATFGDGAPPADEVYWRMESLDVFDGGAWRPNITRAEFYSPETAGGDPQHVYRGTLESIAQNVRIDKLRMEVVPVAGIATHVQSTNLNTSVFQIGEGGTLIYQPQTREGDEYQAITRYANVRQDLGALATVNGELSPLFAGAAEDGLFPYSPGPTPGSLERPADIERFLELPDGLPAALSNVARSQTAGAVTDFERAWLLQWWFRDSGTFVYSTNVTTGHGSLDLENWLTDSTTENFRTGYCEQFASSMAVLGRVLGIPSRVVWGFTPGEVQVVDTESGPQEVVVVRDKNAHAWVEMWMDGFGWVRFDPTPRGDSLPSSVTAAFSADEYLPELVTPGDLPSGGILPFDDPQFELDQTDNPIGDPNESLQISWWWVAIPIAMLIAGAIPFLKSMRRRRRLRRLREGDITAAWQEIVDRLEDLGSPVPAHQTPLEFANSTDRSLVPLARSYSAAIYGDINGKATPDDLYTVENWLKIRYEGGRRTRAAFNPKSLID